MITEPLCHQCPLQGRPCLRNHPTPKSRIVVVTDSPTKVEIASKQTLIGTPGKLVRESLARCGVDVSRIHYTTAVLCSPPEGEKIPAEALKACRGRLLGEIQKVDPEFVLSLGSFSAQTLTGAKGVTRIRGQLHRLVDEEIDLDTVLMPTFNPMAVTRDPNLYRDFSYDIVKVATQKKPIDFQYELWIPTTLEETLDSLRLLSMASTISCDLETTGFDYNKDSILTIGFGASVEGGVPLSIIIPAVFFRQALSEFRSFFETFSGVFVFHNVKFDIKFLRAAFGDLLFRPRETMDTMLMQYARDERGMSSENDNRSYFSVGLKDLGRTFFDIPDFHFDFEEWLKPLRLETEETPLDELYFTETPSQINWTDLYIYHGLDCAVTIELFFKLRELLEYEGPKLFPLAQFLSKASLAYGLIEMNGIQLDIPYLQAYREGLEVEVQDHLDTLQKIALETSGVEGYNPRSSPQNRRVFPSIGLDIEKGEKELLQYEMNRMKYPFEFLQMTKYLIDKPDEKKFHEFYSPMMGREGLPSDFHFGNEDERLSVWKHSASVLGIPTEGNPMEIAGTFFYPGQTREFLSNLLDYRQKTVALKTYAIGLSNRADPETGRVHADFLLHGTDTGRLSARNPNLQNIPAVMGPAIRRAFCARPGWFFVNADYSQLELRVAAFYSRDDNLIEAFKKGIDVHRWVASLMFKKPPEQISKFERYLAKYVDF